MTGDVTLPVMLGLMAAEWVCGILLGISLGMWLQGRRIGKILDRIKSGDFDPLTQRTGP